MYITNCALQLICVVTDCVQQAADYISPYEYHNCQGVFQCLQLSTDYCTYAVSALRLLAGQQ